MTGAPGLVLVVGGAGFVGSHLVDELVATGLPVRVLDVLHPLAHDSRPEYLNPEAEYVWGDVRDAETVGRALAGVEAVSHQGAMVGLGADLGDLPDYVSHNCLGTATLLAAMARAGFDGPLVLASSMVVYGEGRYRCAEHGLARPAPRDPERLEAGQFNPACERCGRELLPEAIPEAATLDPRSVYAATKVHQEHLCSAFARETGASTITLRYHNVYGPRMPRETPYAGVASIFRSALEAGRPPAVYEDGRQLRDFVHVRDVARANRLALVAPPAAAGAYNIASGNPRSVLDLARGLARAAAGPAPEVTGAYRLGDVRHVFAAADRARDALGFEAMIEFDAGVEAFAAAPLRSPASAVAT